jgi:hypothetical protein
MASVIRIVVYNPYKLRFLTRLLGELCELNLLSKSARCGTEQGPQRIN